MSKETSDEMLRAAIYYWGTVEQARQLTDFERENLDIRRELLELRSHSSDSNRDAGGVDVERRSLKWTEDNVGNLTATFGKHTFNLGFNYPISVNGKVFTDKAEYTLQMLLDGEWRTSNPWFRQDPTHHYYSKQEAIDSVQELVDSFTLLTPTKPESPVVDKELDHITESGKMVDTPDSNAVEEHPDHWWCPKCDAWVHCQQVSNDEFHENCGTHLTHCQPLQTQPAAVKVIKRINEILKQRGVGSLDSETEEQSITALLSQTPPTELNTEELADKIRKVCRENLPKSPKEYKNWSAQHLIQNLSNLFCELFKTPPTESTRVEEEDGWN